MDEVVSVGEQRKQPWGIVTSKSARFAMPIAHATGIHPRAGCIFCGDTSAHTKPHLALLLYAADLIGVVPEYCLYVGDDERGIIAAHAAGLVSVAAAYGYLGIGNDIATWARRIDDRTPDGTARVTRLMQPAALTIRHRSHTHRHATPRMLLVG